MTGLTLRIGLSAAMLARVLLVSLAAVALCPSAAASRVQLTSNVYTGLVVGIDDDVPPTRCREIVTNVKALMTAASEQLYIATNQRATFGDVTLVLPRSWPDECTGGGRPEVTPTESYLTSDLRLSTPHPVYGTAPWTHQTGLCAQPAAYVRMAADYVATVTDESLPDKARRVVQQWARYRWGVFEEIGFAEDSLYPSFYRQSADRWAPTVCSDGPVTGSIAPPGCVESSNVCTFVPSGSADNVTGTTSLMSLPLSEQPSRFCSASSHDPAAPTRHNLLCGGRSVWEVMGSHPDFRHGANPPSDNTSVPPVTVRTVKVAPDRFFFLLESTATMRVRHRWDIVSSSVRKFVNWDAPTGARVGIGHFGATYRTDRAVTAVPEALMGRGELANLPPIADDVDEAEKSWRAAADGALAALGGEAAGAVLFWVTGNRNNSTAGPAEADIQYMIRVFTSKQIRLVVVFYPFVTPGLSRVAEATGGSVILVPDTPSGQLTSITVFHALTDAYTLALRRFSSAQRQLPVRVEDKAFVGGGQQVRGSFLLDDSVGGNITLAVMFSSRTDIGYVKLRPPGGLMEPVYTYSDTTNHLQYARVEHTPGLWEYEVDSQAPSSGSIVVQVNAAPAPQQQKAVRVEAWTNADLADTLDASKRPLIIYASVMKGDAAILDAEVHAVVTRPDGQRLRLKLLDNGLGVPDVQRGDGVYSRYFTEFGEAAGAGSGAADRRQFSVRVEVGGSLARAVTSRDSAAPCCGSAVSPVTSVPVPELRRAVSAGAVFVSGLGGGDVYPPSRVTDLTAQVDQGARSVTLRWTAPGDDFDGSDGRALRYEARYCESRSRLRANFSLCTAVPDWGRPDPAGTTSTTTVRLQPAGVLLFLAVRAEDAAGNQAAPSNVVSFVVPLPPTTPPPPALPPSTTAPPAAAQALLRGQTLLIVAVSVAAAALLLLIVVVCCCLRRRRRRHRKSGGATVKGVTTVNGATTFKNPNARHPPPVTISSEVEKKEQVAMAGSGTVAQTPVMWTASDILQQQQQQGVRPPAPDSGYGGGLTGSRASSGRARYNSYQTPYSEDMAYDGRSLGSSQPSDSFLSLSSDARHATTLSETGAGWPSDRDSPPRPPLAPGEPPPLGLPDLQGLHSASPACAELAPGELTPTEIPPALVMLPVRGHGDDRRSAALAYVEGRKRRNITQV